MSARAAVWVAPLLGVALLVQGAVLQPRAAGAAPPASASTGAEGVRIRIESPVDGATVMNRVHQAPIRGNAFAHAESPLAYDVVVAIDVSHSTRHASGSDVDGDGQLGFDPHDELLPPGTFPDEVVCTDPDDTILAAEVAAARALIESLEPGRVRIGVVTFSGEVDLATGERARWNQRDAWVEIPLTEEFDRVLEVLPQILIRGPHGATNFAAGLRVAIRELMGFSGAKSAPRPDSKKVVLLLSDGVPTLPIGKGTESDPGDVEAVLETARLAHKAGITVNTYAIGKHALSQPVAATEIARITLGTYMPVRNPGEIVTFLQAVSFANVDDVVFTNLTTREVSTDVELTPDGRFSGFVPVREGINRVRVTALASDGSSGDVEFDLDFQTAGLSGRELAIELERIRARNKQLMLLIERDRIRRFRDQQRKSLEFEAEE